MQVIESLATRIWSSPTPLPRQLVSLDCGGVAEARTALVPVPVCSVSPARAQPTSAPVPTQWVRPAGAWQVDAPTPTTWRKAAELEVGACEGAAQPAPEVGDEVCEVCEDPKLPVSFDV